MATPNTEPSRLTAGDTASWLKTLADYPATDGWALAYTLINATGKITIGSTAQGADHLVGASATQSAAWPAGDYAYSARVSRTVAAVLQAHTVSVGRFTVAPAFGAASNLETRSDARIALDNINAYLADPGNLKASSYAINSGGGSRTLSRYQPDELIALKTHLQAEVSREDAAARVALGLPDKRRVFVRFGP
jgi:hypothetical protein